MKNYRFLIFVFLGMIVIHELCAQQKKIYIAPDDHTDYMWSANEADYKNAFLTTLDYYIRLNDSTRNDPWQYQSKWNCDGTLWIYEYQKNRSPEQFERLIGQIREGRITVPLNTLESLSGIAPLEVTLRDMYYAGSLERKYGLNLELAMNMEDQVLPLGLSSLWAGAGAKYSWRGVCACATKVTGLEKRPHEIYWYTGLDGRKILMKWYSVNPSMITDRKAYRYYLGTYLEASDPGNAIEDCKTLMDRREIYPYDIAAAFGKGGDDLKTLTGKFPVVAREKTDTNYKVIVSNEIDFFKDFEKEYGAILPSESVSYGSTEWGNSIASLAEVSATIKRSAEKLRGAEALYAIVSLKDKEFASGLAEKKERAWLACGKYFEHDWTADGNIIPRKQRAEWQRKIALQFTTYVDTLFTMSVNRLGELISPPDGYSETFFVFNSLGWLRSDYADYPFSGSGEINVLDITAHSEVPFQIIERQGVQYLRILAKDIPSLGYKAFAIRKGAPSTRFAMAASVSDSVIENGHYKIVFSREGVITSLLDKKNHNRECILPVNSLYANDLGSGKANNGRQLIIENTGPVSVTVVAQSDRPVNHISRLTLFGESDRIEIENCITGNIEAKPLTYAFSFDLKVPETWHEEAGAILKARQKSMGGHYADSICRLDWLALNHFVQMSDGNSGIVISNRDAYFMQTGNSTIKWLDPLTPQIKILAAGQIDAPGLGIVNQDGDSHFDNFFALKPDNNGFDAAASMKFALEHQNPLITGQITGTTGGYGLNYSLFSIANPDILVWAVKPAEEGIASGIILRVWNMNDHDSDFSVAASTPLVRCYRDTHIEVDKEKIDPIEGELKVKIGHNHIETFRIFCKGQ
jgi:alpha-mannosidase